MLGTTATADTRAARREAKRERILEAAWRLARRDGITGFSLRDLAKAVGMRAPSLYSYFDSKLALYDAMFAQANRELLAEMDDGPDGDFEETLRDQSRRFFRFSTADPARHQLLFQNAVPGFEPSPESYALAVEALDRARRAFAEAGLTDEALDMWTAIVSGLVNQQLANDPGGDRWERLLDDAVDMFLDHVGYERKGRTR